MGRPKRRSLALEKAKRRCDAVSTIDPKLDFGEGLTLAAYQSKIKAGTDQLNSYNQLVAATDASSAELRGIEAEIAGMSRRILKGVASRYGEDSVQYGKAGGTRESESRRSKKSKAKALKAVA